MICLSVTRSVCLVARGEVPRGAEIRVPSVEKPELSKGPSLKPRVHEDVALRASVTARKFCLSNLCLPGHSISFSQSSVNTL